MQLSPKLRKALSLVVVFTLVLQQAGFAQGLAQLDISRYLGSFSSTPLFRPVLLRYFSYDPLNESFQLLLDKGTLKKVEDTQLKEQGQELLRYFLVGVALPDENFWVNLRPDSEDEVISGELAMTDVGKILLEADLQLKKDVARFTSPETPEGREYWNKLYQKAGQIFTSSEITIPTLTRPWIVPGEVIIRENETSAYVYKGTLKVMLEQDYLQSPSSGVIASESNVIASPAGAKQSLYDAYSFKDPRLKELNEYSTKLIRETIIPKLTKEVNSSKRYAALRQVFFSLILSRWFKHKFAGTVPVRAKNYASQEGLFQTVSTAPAYINLINSGDLTNLTSKEPWSKTTYFGEYKKSFAQGEYNLKEQVNSITGPVIRNYFSGGVAFAGEIVPKAASPVTDPGGLFHGPSSDVSASLIKGMVPLVTESSSPITSSPMAPTKMVYFAGNGKSEGFDLITDPTERNNLLGGKGLSIHESTSLGFPVPPSFTITTQVGVEFMKTKQYPPGLKEEVQTNLKKVEGVMGQWLGDLNNPLLVSVRSGARTSMPGMMDTVLNLGSNDQIIEALAEKSGNLRWAYDNYRRFFESYGHIVLGIAKERFDEIREPIKKRLNIGDDSKVPGEVLKNRLIPEYKALIKQHEQETGQVLPTNPEEQLDEAIEAVFRSWFSERAVEYRIIHPEISEDWGTAVTVQAMVFGNMNDNSGTGVYFTRDRSTGEKVPFGDYTVNAQGEDVVSGAYPVEPIQILKDRFPDVFKQLMQFGSSYEQRHKDMGDIEFTIQDGRFWVLQSRVGKRTPLAAVKIAVDMVKEDMITKEEAILRVSPEQVIQSLVSKVDPKAIKTATLLTTGEASTLGAASGKIAFSQDLVLALKARGVKVIFCRPETDAKLVKGIVEADGTLTERGGSVSHAIIVGAAENKVVVAGAEQVEIDEKAGVMRIGDQVLHEATIRTDAAGKEVVEGDEITIDADPNSRKVYLGAQPLISGQMIPELRELLAWADSIATMEVWANADTPDQARKAREYGAKGLGLVRTEHMFFAPERMPIMQRMIMAGDDAVARRAALDELEQFQKKDFEEIFEAMDGLPTVIRLLDPPLHEFLPGHEELALEIQKLELENGDQEEIAKKKKVLEAVTKLQEVNPMLGLRGARLGVLYPDITEMQSRAIAGGAANVFKKKGVKVIPKIMIPLINRRTKFDDQAEKIRKVTNDVFRAEGVSADEIPYRVGTMIELVAAALNAGEIARGEKGAAFFSFGTNDLTQTLFGYSRDDAERGFLGEFLRRGLMKTNPFVELQPETGEMVGIGVERGRASKPGLEIGICGEHARNPNSVRMFHDLGLDYVSPSSVGVLSARLAAAQAELKNPRREGPAAAKTKKESTSSPIDGQKLVGASSPAAETHLRIPGIASQVSYKLTLDEGDRLFRTAFAALPSSQQEARLFTIFTPFDVQEPVLVAVQRQHGLRQLSVENGDLFMVKANTGELIFIKAGMQKVFDNYNPNAKSAQWITADKLLTLSDTGAASSPVEVNFEIKNLSKKLVDRTIWLHSYPFTLNDRLRKVLVEIGKKIDREPDRFKAAVTDSYEFGSLSVEPHTLFRLTLAYTLTPIGDNRYKIEGTVSSLGQIDTETPPGTTLAEVTGIIDVASSAASPMVQVPKTPGGIDFRVITMITQPMGNLSGLNFSLPHLSNLENINLDEELEQIQRMLQAGIIPSGERLKEFVAVCFQKGELKEHLGGIVSCLVDMCRLEEENALEASNELKEVLLIIDAV